RSRVVSIRINQTLCAAILQSNDIELPYYFSKWLDLINNQRVGKDIHETFHRELDGQQDKFGVIAEFLGRRLFDKE
ncbi:unnamed protein product, partial [Rotaria magnacalcarata]